MKDFVGQERLFRRYRGGDGGALVELLEGERQRLYDYMLRMTGQAARSSESIDDVFQSLTEETLTITGTWAELRECLFGTARKINGDIWNADTSRLINLALEGPERDEDLERSDGADLTRIVNCDHAWRALTGREREVVWLKYRLGMTDPEIAPLMQIGEFDVTANLGRALGALGLAAGVEEPALERVIRRVPLHPLPVRSTATTVNLTDVMQGIKTRPTGMAWRSWFIPVLILCLGYGIWVLKPDWVKRVREAMTSRKTPPLPTMTAPAPGMPPGLPPGFKERSSSVPPKS